MTEASQNTTNLRRRLRPSSSRSPSYASTASCLLRTCQLLLPSLRCWCCRCVGGVGGDLDGEHRSSGKAYIGPLTTCRCFNGSWYTDNRNCQWLVCVARPKDYLKHALQSRSPLMQIDGACFPKHSRNCRRNAEECYRWQATELIYV